MKIIQRNYHFSNMKKQVMSYIKKYYFYQINKYTTYIKYKQPQIIETSERSWHIITIDFIIKLLKLKDLITGIKYNTI